MQTSRSTTTLTTPVLALSAVLAAAVTPALGQYAHHHQTAHSQVTMLARAGVVLPERDDEWDVGAKFDLGYVFWASPHLGLWLGAGAQGWNVAEERIGLGGGSWADISGRVSLVPIGASVLWANPMNDNLSLQLETGLRYTVVDSKARVETWRPYSRTHMAVTTDPIEIDDTVLGIVSLTAAYTSGAWSLGAGVGYQWDLVRPDQKIDGHRIAETKFDAALLMLTLNLHF